MIGTSTRGPAALAALVSSRLCHDLISPVGAIGNGLELLQGSMPPSPELDLVAESAATASAKIRFFRIAFGAASEVETLDGRTLADTLKGAYASSRIAVDWLPEALPRREARLLFLIILCAESALPLGGAVAAERDGPVLRLAAEGRRTRFEPEPWAHLCEGQPFEGCSSALVHFLLARQHAGEAGRRALLARGETAFSLVLGPG